MAIPGSPAIDTPATRFPGILRWAMYHIEGAEEERWGSLAKSGLPVIVCAPETTQLLLAALSMAKSPSLSREWRISRSSSAIAAMLSAPAIGPGDGFPWEANFFVLILSLPTSSTSRGDVSGKSASRVFLGRSLNAARVMSSRQLVESDSSSSLLVTRESATLHGRGVICRI